MNEDLALQLFEFSKTGNLEGYINNINPNVKMLDINPVVNYDNNLQQYELSESIIEEKKEAPQYTQGWDNSNLDKMFNKVKSKNILERMLDKFESLLDKFEKWASKDDVKLLDKGKEAETTNTVIEENKKTDNIFALSDEEKARHNARAKEIAREYKENNKGNTINKNVDNDYEYDNR